MKDSNKREKDVILKILSWFNYIQSLCPSCWWRLQRIYLKTQSLVIASNNNRKMTCYKTYKSWGQQMYEIVAPSYDLIGDIHSYYIGKRSCLF
jgi:predicted alpha/beta superfamily hydrolase